MWTYYRRNLMSFDVSKFIFKDLQMIATILYRQCAYVTIYMCINIHILHIAHPKAGASGMAGTILVVPLSRDEI